LESFAGSTDNGHVPRRVIAIDLGARRIGVAVTDALGMTAQPHATIARRGGRRDLDAIAALVRTHDAERVVLGLPLAPDGEEGRALIDESFSTVEAEELLLAADVSRARRREVIDKIAAAVILRRWLDSNAR
jgi:putative holliday junction resolvase